MALESTRGADLCLPNLEEGAFLARTEDPERIAERLLSHYAGADGGWEREPAVPSRVVDTTGAGDALCAGFLSARLSGASPAEALRRGVRLSTEAVARVGARPGA